MKNFVAGGRTITVIAPTGGATAGELVVVGQIAGVAAGDAAQGAEVEVSVEGVFKLAKASALAIAQGDTCKADATGVIAGTGTVICGYATAAAGAGTTTVAVRLTPHAA
jgi:predicted RecA/RadA family phage recombinase